MNDFQQKFLAFAFKQGALQFGNFKLRSGRVSPYYFNSGAFSDGASLATLASYYADTIIQHFDEDFMLFGPAYKGISLVTATAVILNRDYDKKTNYAFNRKEEKAHGDGGWIVGAPVDGKVIIVEDVITSGASIKAVVDLIRKQAGEPIAATIALDRAERADGEEESIANIVEATLGLKVIPIADAYDLLKFVENKSELKRHADSMRAYLQEYAV